MQKSRRFSRLLLPFYAGLPKRLPAFYSSAILSSGKGGSAKRSESKRKQLQLIVVGGNPVRRQYPADAAAVDYRPFAALSHPHRDRLHCPAAVCRTVARLDVEVLRAEAVRTVVAVTRPGAVRQDSPAAELALERLVRRPVTALSFFPVFVIHVYPPKSIRSFRERPVSRSDNNHR